MHSRLVSFVLPAILIFTGSTQFAQAKVQSRIASIDAGSQVPLRGTISSRAKRASDLGAAPADRQLSSLTLFFSLTPSQQADLDQLLVSQVDPGSPQYHQWLTPEQFGARFGISSSDLAKVSAWLTGQGFKMTETARSSTFVRFSGTVAQAQRAFGTTIHSLSVDGEQHISNLTDPVLPSAINAVVTSLTGLNDFRMKPRSRSIPVSIDRSKPLNTQTLNGVVNHFIAPGDLYTIYDFPAYSPTAGAGVTIAVVGQTDLNQGSTLPDLNVAAFRAAAGLPAINLKLQFAGGTDPGVSTSDIDEAHLDVEWSGAAAPGATILYVYGFDAFGNSLVYAVDNKVAPILSSSYGGCELQFNATTVATTGQSELAAYNNILAQANAQGMTVVNSAGDAGAADCDTSGLATEGLNVDFPASSPYVTAAGGTMFSGDVTTPSAYWSGTNGANGGSALSYIPEQPWDETSTANGLSGGGAGGGGASAFFAKPTWQMGTGAGATPNDASRDVPDFALNAAAMHDGYFVCSTGTSTQELPCSNGFLDSTGNPNVFGGTSFVAPTMAGILALVEQHLGVGGTAATGLGNINYVLYGLANGPTYSSIFHDITSGTNSVPCSQGTSNCTNGGAIGFSAATGYDQASGLGSLDVANLISNWSSATPTGIGGTASQGGISATTLTTTASTLCGLSTNLLLSAKVTGSIAATAPGGSVEFFVDGALVAGSSTPLTNGTASYSLATTALSSGGHTISAVYSGDTNYAGSKGTLLANGTLASVDVVSTTKPDFSITPCSAAVTVNPGATAPGIAFTITPANGFTGSVNMTATNHNGMIATTSFSVSPVSITSAGGVSTSFVIVASQTSSTGAARSAASSAKERPLGKSPWYAAGSGATLACVLLFGLPRRRRLGALFAAILSVAVFTVSGCSNTSTTGGTGSGGGGTTTPTVTVATAGTYTFTITGVAAGGLAHSAQVTVTVP